MILNSSGAGGFDPVRAEWARRPDPAPQAERAGPARGRAGAAPPSPAAAAARRRGLLAIGAWLAALPPDFEAGA